LRCLFELQCFVETVLTVAGGDSCDDDDDDDDDDIDIDVDKC